MVGLVHGDRLGVVIDGDINMAKNFLNRLTDPAATGETINYQTVIHDLLALSSRSISAMIRAAARITLARLFIAEPPCLS